MKTSAGPPWKKAGFVVAIAIAVVAGVLLYRFRGTPFQWNRFFSALTDVDWVWMAGSICLMLLTYVGRALRWAVMLRPLRPNLDFRGLCSATVIGFTAVTILGRAGELVRPYLIAVKERVPFPSQMAAWLLERILDTLVVLLIFGIGLVDISGRGLHLSAGLEWIIRTGGYMIAALCGVCLLFLVVFRSFAEVAEGRILAALSFLPERPLARIRETLGAFSKGMQSTRDRSVLISLSLYTALEWLLIVAAFQAMFRAFAATRHFTWMDTLIFVGFVSLGSIVQIPGIGGGVQVATIVVLTEIFGIPLEASSGLALLIWVLSFVIIVPFGLLFAFHEGINWSKFKHLPEDIPA
jgi:uncharacterized protein (TIRG00374 family)